MNVKFSKKKIMKSKSPTWAIIGVGRPQARGLRGSIEIAKCLHVTNSRGSRLEFRERDDRFATLLECFLNFLSAPYLDRQCMNSGKVSQFEKHLSQKPLETVMGSSKNRGKEAKGKIMIRNKNKNKTKKIYNNNKKYSSHDISDIYFVTGFFKNTPNAVCSCCPSAL